MFATTTEANPVETFGKTGATANFQVALTPKMAEQLSNPYSDVVTAILREYANNEMDSHIAAGKPNTPIQVVLPTVVNPQVVFRGYGTGMSYDFVMKSFNTWGMSTKDSQSKDPNQQYTGSLGRGSKVGFGYNTKSFTVVSRYGADKMTFSAYTDEDSMPVLVHVNTQTNDADYNGVEITVPVAIRDIDDFHDKARRVFQYWNPMPHIPNINAPIMEPDYHIQAEDGSWGLRRVRNPRQSEPRAVMGRVAYPLRRTSINDPEVERMLEMPIDIHFQLGELDFTESREELKYSEKVKENIARRVHQIASEIPAYIESTFNDCNTYWEACNKAAVLEHGPTSFHFERILREYAYFRGQKVRHSLKLQRSTSADFAEIDNRQWRNSQINFHWSDMVIIDLRTTNNVYILWDDRTSHKKRRMIEHNFGAGDNVYIIRTTDQGVVDELMDHLGNPPLWTWRDLEDPPKQPAAQRKKTVTKKLYRFQPDGVRWETCDKDVDAGGYYVHLYNGEIASDRSSRRLESALKVAVQNGVIQGSVYGIPATHKTLPNKRPQWVEAITMIEAQVKQQINWQVYNDRQAFAANVRENRGPVADCARRLVTQDAWPSVDNPMYRLMVAINYALNEISEYQIRLSELVDKLDIAVAKALTPQYDYLALVAQAKSRFPLIDEFRMFPSSSGDARVLIDNYIDLT